MKKTISILMALALIVSAAAIPALAEEGAGTTDTVTSATTATGKGGPGGRNQMPGNGQQSPVMPGNGQNSPNGPQFPSTPGSRPDSKSNGQNRSGGKNHSGKQPTQLFDQLLQDGVITQEIYDAIINYIKEKAPQEQTGITTPAEGSEPPALPDGTSPAEGSEPPALPDGVPGGTEAQMLKDLLDSGAITQEQYDLLLARITGTVPADSGI